MIAMYDQGVTRPTVGEMIRLLRERRGLSQRSLCVAIGRSASYVSKLEAGEHDPSIGAFARVALALELNPQEMWVLLRIAGADDAARDTVAPDVYDQHSLAGSGSVGVS